MPLPRGKDSGRITGYPEVIHTDEKAIAIPIFRNPTFSGLRYRRERPDT